MSTKSNLLIELEKNKGDYISGQELARILRVSRTAVWKAVKDLKDEGYSIEAVTNKGYALSEDSNILSAEAIKQDLAYDPSIKNILVFKELDSTNNEAKKMIMNDAPFGTVILAEKQTWGKGRRGKGFVSPPGDSIYVSFILKPLLDVRDSLLITVAASVAVTRAIEKIGKINNASNKPQIKWVNDVFLNNKKVCGILTEAVSDIESGQIQSLVLGIGININIDKDNYPEDIKKIVGDVKFPSGQRNLFASILIDEVFKIQDEIFNYSMSDMEEPPLIEEYRLKSMVINKDFFIISDEKKVEAHVLDIDGRGRLKVKYKTGETDILSTGEISIRINE